MIDAVRQTHYAEQALALLHRFLALAAGNERRQRDVEAWIRQGIEQGTVRADVDVTEVARQFCAAIIGIVYQWLVAPEALQLIQDLHTGLKQQMTRALAARATTGDA